MSHTRRAEAALRVRGLHPPLPEIFAALRAALGEEPPPPPPAPEPQPQPQPAPEPVPEPADPLADALLAAARAGTGNADDITVSLAMALEGPVAAVVRAGARAAREAGVPGDGDISHDRALDAVLSVLAPYAASVAAADIAPQPPAELLARIRGIARSAGVVEAVRDTPWSVVQRFGEPWCPRSACYGRNGSLLSDDRIAAEGYPPYGDGCNCVAEPADLP